MKEMCGINVITKFVIIEKSAVYPLCFSYQINIKYNTDRTKNTILILYNAISNSSF
jgi:hypothetical protein